MPNAYLDILWQKHGGAHKGLGLWRVIDGLESVILTACLRDILGEVGAGVLNSQVRSLRNGDL